MTRSFKGIIGRTADESLPWWDEPTAAPEGAPNVLWIVLDDVGFAQLGCYGSDIRTPNLDALAGAGLQYTSFHTAAMCSPTRACLLTGRNHHSVGMAALTELATGFPGYNARISREHGFLSEVLSAQGYACFCLGKWHVAPDEEVNMAASKERWPLGRGFERFYGFLGGHTDQFKPNLVYDNHPIDPPRGIEEGYHLTEDLADRAIEFVTDLKNIAPEKPFFLYFAPGAMHSPHQAPQAWIDRYAGRFDQGWDRWREAIYQRQLDAGIIPPGTELPPRPGFVPAWESLGNDAKRLYARFMEVYAGFLEHTDHHIGRLLGFLDLIGELDNTLVMVVSDNGASAEGGPFGSINEVRLYNAVPYTLEENLAELDKLGGPESYANYPWGWTWAGNTPLRRWKRMVHEGGVADPMLVHWPKGIAARSEIRRQYTHAIDLAPTVLDVLGIEPPAQIDGVSQSPLEGTSFAYTFDDAQADSRHTTQYYEMLGSRAIYHKGWKAVTYKPVLPMLADEGGVNAPDAPFDDDVWELYHVAQDLSEAHDVSAQHPQKLRELQDIWWAEAGRYNVLPLDNRGTLRFLTQRPKIGRDRMRYVYYPFGAPISESVAANLKNRSHTISAEVEIPESGAEGVLLAHGGRYGGYALYVQDNCLHYVHNYLNITRFKVSSGVEIPSGPCTLAFGFELTGPEPFGAGGTGRLYIDGELVGQGAIGRTVGVRYHLADDGLCVGYDSETPVSDDYRTPFRFTGSIRRVVVDVSGELFYDPELEVKVALATQ